MSKLATFNIDESLWEDFKQWTKSNGSNASSELLGHIKNCLGVDQHRIINTHLDEVIDKAVKVKVLSYLDLYLDEYIDSRSEAIDRIVNEKVSTYLDLYVDEYLDKRLGRDNHIEKSLDKNIDTQEKPLPEAEGVKLTHKDRLTLEDTEQELMVIKASIAGSGVKRANKEIADRLNLRGFPSPIEGKKWSASMVSSWMTKGRV